MWDPTLKPRYYDFFPIQIHAKKRKKVEAFTKPSTSYETSRSSNFALKTFTSRSPKMSNTTGLASSSCND